MIPGLVMAGKQHERRITRDMGPLAMRAAVQPSTIDDEARTVEVVWTTGARVMRGFWERYWEELSLDPKHVRLGRLGAGAPLLDSHRSYETRGVIGVVESAKLEKGRGVATVRFAREDAAADAIWRKVKDGILRNVSVGYRVHRLEKIEEDADKIPVYRATDWEPMEISVVPIGADAGASVRGEGPDLNPCEFVDDGPLETRNMAKQNDPQGGAPAPATPPADTERSAPAVDVDKERAAAAKAERERIAAIQRTAAALDLVGDEMVQRAIDEGTDLDAFRAAAIDARAERKAPVVDVGSRPSVVAGEDERDKFLRGAGDWLITRAGQAPAVVEDAKRRGETMRVEPGEFRGRTLLDIARMCLERAGVRTAGMSKKDIVGHAFTHRAAYQTTSDFPVLLENTLHKMLLASYGTTPDTWSRFCARGSVSDFRAHNRYRLGTFGTLDTVAEHGEFTYKAMPDGRKETITAATKGNRIALSRQAIINDDMGSFARLAALIGRMAALSIEVDVYALLALNGGLGPAMGDTKTLFHADHGNINGTGSTLAVAGIDADRVVLASQTDDSGNEILDLRPAVLLVPIGLGGDARVINDAQYDPDTANKLQKPNKVRGLFRDIVDTPRMSGTRRYMFADPAVAPVLEVAFLDGQSEPYLEMKDGWSVDGVEWKVRLDYATGAIDYRGAVTNAGTP